MIYYTGDIHGQKYEIERFCKRFNPTREDTQTVKMQFDTFPQKIQNRCNFHPLWG